MTTCASVTKTETEANRDAPRHLLALRFLDLRRALGERKEMIRRVFQLVGTENDRQERFNSMTLDAEAEASLLEYLKERKEIANAQK